jgi:hypothetical protein
MKRFVYSSSRNPCVICGNTAGDCRAQGTLFLCITEHNSVPGFRFIGDTKNLLWGKFVEDTGTPRQPRQQLNIREQLTRERQQKASALPPETRNRLNEEIIGQLAIAPIDMMDLERRGITPQDAKVAGFRSIEQWQRLERPIPYRLAGLGIDGRSLCNYHAGYLCPVRNIHGDLTAFQIRLRKGGYRWLSSYNAERRPNGAMPNLPNGEIPLAVWRPTSKKPTSISLAEGTGPKPFIVAEKLQSLVIGAAGGLWASSPETLQETLEVASQELQTRVIHFYPDAGAVINPNVLRQYRLTWKLLKNWGYHIEIGWWGQIEKADCDIDELLPDQIQQIEWISVGRFESIVHDPQRMWRNVRAIFQKAKERFYRPFRGFGNVSVIPTYESITYEPGKLPTPEEYEQLGCPRIIFQHNERLDIWREAIAKGWKHILDSSAPGLGKSYTGGVAIPEAFTVKKLFFWDVNHRNPTTSTVERNYQDLPVRNNGFVRDTVHLTPLGNDSLHWPKPGEEPNTPGNCHRTPLFAALREKNIEGEQESGESEVCKNCHTLMACRAASGAGFGFRHDRRVSLGASRIRAHPESAPSPVEFDFLSCGSFWEEAGRLIKPMNEVSTGLADFQRALGTDLFDVSPEYYRLLTPLREALLPLMRGDLEEPYHGFDHQAITRLLPEIPSNITDIILRLQFAYRPKLSFLNNLEEYGVQIQDLPKSYQRKMRADLGEMAGEIKKTILLNWLLPFLRVWSGQPGAFRFSRGKLTIYSRDEHHANIARASKFNIYLDATVSRQYIALSLDTDQKTVLEVQQQTPNHGNLRILQVVGMGKLGKDRSKAMKRRVSAIREALEEAHPGIAFGDWKSHATGSDGAWFVNLRGTNEFENCSSMATFGIPYQNLGYLQCLWQVVTGEYVSLDKDNPHAEFQAFCDAFIRAEIIQAIGRLRAHLRPEEELLYYFLGDYDLSFIDTALPNTPVTIVKASDISLDACSFFEANLLGIFQGLRAAAELGVNPTQTFLSQKSGISQGQISKVAKQVGGLSRLKQIFQSLLDKDLIANGIIQEATEDEVFIAREFLQAVLEHEPESLIQEISTVVSSFGFRSWERIVRLLPTSVRVGAIAQLTDLLKLSQFVPEDGS